jgi:hypothetical protein
MRSGRYLGWLLLLVALLAGCKERAADTVPVSGRVTIDRQPLANATVTFTPAEASDVRLISQSSGKTDEQGRFSLQLDADNRSGAIVGIHRVRVSIFDRGSEGKPGKGQLLPREYNRDSILTFTVPAGGTTEANFDLSRNPAPPIRRGPR